MKNKYLLPLTLYALVLFNHSCNKEVRPCDASTIDPENDAPCLCRSLDIVGGTLEEGELPEPRGVQHIQVNSIQSSANLTAGTKLYVPFRFTAEYGLAGVMLTVAGSGYRWKIPLGGRQKDGDYIIQVEVPDIVQNGSFNLSFVLIDGHGFISEARGISIGVDNTVHDVCGPSQYYAESGYDGLTVRKLKLGPSPGKVLIYCDTYSVPDRMDVRFNDKWVASTALAPLAANELPPPSECNDGTAGYVSQDLTLQFDYDPSLGNTFEIYMFGCFGGGTAWDFKVYCPD